MSLPPDKTQPQRLLLNGGIAWAALSLALLLTAIAWDAARHAAGSAHAGERFLEWDNPGHLLAAFAIANLVAATAAVTVTRWLVGQATTRRVAGALVVIAIAAVVYAGAIVKLDGDSAGHDSAAAPADRHGAKAVLSENAQFQALEDLTFHEPANLQPITRQNLDYAEDFLAKARAGTAKYKDVSVAMRERYIQATQDLPLIGAHFINPNRADEFDPARPPILLYRQTGDGGWELAGVAYVLPKSKGIDVPPRTPLGGLASWHYHTNLCFSPDLAVAPAANASRCDGQYVPETPWLLHAWIWLDSPEGVFHHANSLLQ